MVALVDQVVEQPAVGWVGGPAGDELVERAAEPLRLGRDLDRAELAGVTGIPDRQRLLEQAPDGVRGLGLAALGVLQQLGAAA
jgi:hypothetical protein